MKNWPFWLLLIITIIRQLPHLILEWKNRRQPKQTSQGAINTVLLYAIYLIIWIICLLRASALITIHPVFLAIGLALLVSSITLRYLSLFALRQNFSSNITIFQNQQLITSGPYSFIRHPLHLALLIELLGMIVYVGVTDVWYLIVIWLLLFPLVIYRNHQEDELLLQQFGQSARLYQNTTPSMNIIKGVINQL